MGRWIIRLALIAGLAPALAMAGELVTPGEADHAAIRGIIESQLDAFQQDDGTRAFSYASPGIRQRFGTADNFMAMVRSGYAAVYRPQEVEFLDSRVRGDIVGQAVRFVGPNGRSVIGIYTMEKQVDGTWRINGVQLIPIDETSS